MTQKIIPNIWFDRQSEEAANFYTSTFKNSKIGNITRAGKAGFEITGIPEGTVVTLEFRIENYRFIAINGGPLFKPNPSISFLVACSTKEEVDTLWGKLSRGGSAMMELGKYPHSERYGWVTDKYVLNWQLMYLGNARITSKITPTLMYSEAQWGKAEPAVNFYTAVFKNTKIDHIMRYNKGEEPDKEGTVRHAGFMLEKQEFAAMDSARTHGFTFNEAISLMVECGDQKEIDYYWDKLTADGGQESNCGWLKDKYGVSWQVSPVLLRQMLGDKDAGKVERVTNAFLKMKKFDIEALKKAYAGK
jgi:predicted 3-demethylubiquinone-9 3-methyltransferase (glyoxalase superfamily)